MPGTRHALFSTSITAAAVVGCVVLMFIAILPGEADASELVGALTPVSDPFAPFATVVAGPASPGAAPAAAPAPSAKALAEQAGMVREQLQQQQAAWASPEAAAERVASRTRFRHLDAIGVVDAARDAFAGAVATAPWRAFDPGPGAAIKRYKSDRVAVVAGPGGEHGLVDSLLPLRTTADDGSSEPVDPELQDVGSGFAPANSLVPSTMPKNLVDGISVGSSGLRLAPGATSALDPSVDPFAWSAERASKLLGNKVVYANVVADTDWMAGPTALGIELLLQLRSPDSPEAHEVALALPDDSRLEVAPDGSGDAVVTRGNTVLYRIEAPSAIDAQGRPVPASYVVSGDTLTVEVSHRDGEWAYPILVDPLIDDQRYWDTAGFGIQGWSYSAQNPYFSGWFDGHMNIRSSAPTYYPTLANAWWTYAPPAGSGFVYRAEFGHQSFTTTIPQACFTEGVVDGGSWAQGAGSPYLNCSSFSAHYQTSCVQADCSAAAGRGAFAAVQVWMNGDGTRTQASSLAVGGTVVAMSDPDAPAVSLGLSTGWMSSKPTSATVSASDVGLGVDQINLSNADGTWDGARQTSMGCMGSSYWPCPASTSITSTFTPLRDGVTTLTFGAYDADLKYTSGSQDVRVDTSSPALTVSGPLRDFASRELPQDAYTVTASATDGDGGSAVTASSGVTRIQFFVDGTSVQDAPQSCANAYGSCSESSTYTFHPYSFAQGTHIIKVVATDAVGHTSSQQWSVVTAAGIVNEPTAGQHVAQRLILQADGKQSGQTGITYQFRRTSSDTWTTVPAAAVTDLSLAPIAGWPVALSGASSPSLAWDLTKTPGIGDVSGPVQVRGLFAGGAGGTTQVVGVSLDRTGVTSGGATADVGPGSVDLLTGNFSVEYDDVAIRAPVTDLTLTRNYNSRAAGGAAGILGPGWSATVGVEAAESQYLRLTDTRGDSAQLTELDGRQISFAYTADGLVPEFGAGDLKLTASADVTPQQRTFTLTDDSGTVTTFGYAGVGSQYVPTKVVAPASSGAQTSTTYSWGLSSDGTPRIARVLAPVPSGVSCDSGLVAGCRALSLVYASSTTASGTGSSSWGDYTGRLVRVDYTAYDPATAAMQTVAVQRYAYDNTGALRAAWDPRISPTLKTTWDYTSGLVTGMTPPGEQPWSVQYSSGAAAGTLQSVSRPTEPDTGPATTSVVYGVPLSGANAPYQMGPSDTAAWGQAVQPSDATAIFAPGQAASTDPAALRMADVYYIDVRDNEDNAALAGGRLSTTEHDRFGNVVRELTAANRERALASSTPAATAKQLDTQRTYSTDGTELLRELGPLQQLRPSTWTVPTGADANVGTLATDSPHRAGKGTATFASPYGGYMGTVSCGASQLTTDFDVGTNATGKITKWQLADVGASTCSVTNGLGPTATVTVGTTPLTTASALNTAGTGGTLTITSPQIQIAYPAANITCTYGTANTGGKLVATLTAPSNVSRPTLDQGWAIDFSNSTLYLVSGSTSGFCGTYLTFNATYVMNVDRAGPISARTDTTYTYDQGAPAGGPYRLVTTKKVGALEPGKTIDTDIRTTTYGYSDDGNAGWTLRAPTRETVDPSGLALVTRSVYDAVTGLLQERRLPASPNSSTASATKFYYYSSSTPQWANLPQSSGPASSALTPNVPSLPSAGYKYNMLGEVTTQTDTSIVFDGTSSFQQITRTTTLTYDPAGRETSRAVATAGSTSASMVGAPVPKLTTTYDPANGKVATTTDGTRTISRQYDGLGRVRSYTDADGNTTTTTYDAQDRPVTVDDGKGVQTTTYDPVTGNPTKVVDSAAGTFTAAYDADDDLTRLDYPNGLRATTTYNEDDVALEVAYDKTTSCSTACRWLDFQSSWSVHGQEVGELSSLGRTAASYDAASRLTLVKRTPTGGGCTTSNYTYNADSDRTKLVVHPPAADGTCDTFSTGTATSYTYDAYDRMNSTVDTYDAWGDQLTMTAAEAGGTALSSTYYANGRTKSTAQGTSSVAFALDPLNRIRVRTPSGASAETQHYGDDEDAPSWTERQDGSGWSRDVGGPDGTLVAIEDSASGTKVQLTDLHGDVVATASLADSATGVLDTFDADEFGNPVGGSVKQPYQWLGAHQREAELPSGVTTMGVRTYVPAAGRFLQVDPVLGGSANRYDYANQDPLSQYDLDGEDTKHCYRDWLTGVLICVAIVGGSTEDPDHAHPHIPEEPPIEQPIGEGGTGGTPPEEKDKKKHKHHHKHHHKKHKKHRDPCDDPGVYCA